MFPWMSEKIFVSLRLNGYIHNIKCFHSQDKVMQWGCIHSAQNSVISAVVQPYMRYTTQP